MKPACKIAVLFLSCWFLFSAAGCSVTGSKENTTPGVVAGSFPALPTREGLRGGTLAQAREEDLWLWAKELSLAGKMGDDRLRNAVFRELIRRLGWAAWDQALREPDSWPRIRLTGGVLNALAEREPWKAYEIWKQREKEFQDPEGWADDVPFRAVVASGRVSAARMIRVLRENRDEVGGAVGYPRALVKNYRKDFDFHAVAEYLYKDRDHIPLDYFPGDLLRTWERRSPGEAKVWIRRHPGMREEGESE